jgi:4-hydroxy-4-methyl-2-oxoglutarate aldolase
MSRMTMFMSALGLIASLAMPAHAQLGMFSKDQLIAVTRAWTGERFPDGRPKVSDEILERMKTVDAEEAWGALRQSGFFNQFEGGWKVINPGSRVAGRVVTAVFMPLRPDLEAYIREQGKAEGRVGAENSWVIDTLVPGDVLVVDLFGKIKDGTFAGDNLGTAIFSKSHNALVVDGSVRDVTGMSEIHGFQVFVRDVDPSALRDVTLVGLNVPIRIGHATVLPGDIAVSDPEGITFIPPQLCEKVADSAELTHLIDEWGHMMLREGKYTPGQIDGPWTSAMKEEFNRWVEQEKHSKLRLK